MLTLKEKVWYFALCSRLCVLVVSSIFNFLLPDHAADAFLFPLPDDIKESYCDIIVNYLLGGLARWDSQYFMHITLYGYTYENVLAFFPLFPLITRAVAGMLYFCFGEYLNEISLFLLSSVLINIVCFVKSATILYELSLRVLQNEQFAYISGILYCVNPASIFFTALYSESLYACLTFYAMLKCGSGSSVKFSTLCGVIFGLAAITRSNGISNIGFIAYRCLKSITSSTLPRLTTLSYVHTIVMIPINLLVLVIAALPYIISTAASLGLFVTFQLYGYYKFCFSHSNNLPAFLVQFAQMNNLVLPSENVDSAHPNNMHWCNYSIPFSYSYVQSHYWNVGFLRYYELKQIPNFLLALPVIWIILRHSYLFVRKYFQYCLFLGLCDNFKSSEFKQQSQTCSFEICLPKDALPYVLHGVFLTLFSIFCIHVQVTTRLIASSSPLLYWFATTMIAKGIKPNKQTFSKLSEDLLTVVKKKKELPLFCVESLENMHSKWKVFIISKILYTNSAKFVQIYFLLYLFLGTVLFSNFLPWT